MEMDFLLAVRGLTRLRQQEEEGDRRRPHILLSPDARSGKHGDGPREGEGEREGGNTTAYFVVFLLAMNY